MFFKFKYLLLESFRGLFRNKFMSFAIIATTAIFLYFIAAFFVGYTNLSYLLEVADNQIVLEAFLEDDIPNIRDAKNGLSLIPGVDNIEFISEEEAYEKFQHDIGKDILGVIEGNPLPASFILSISKPYRHSDSLLLIEKAVKEVPYIEDVTSAGEWVSKLKKIHRYFSLGSILFITLFLLTIFFVISATNKITIMARQDLIYVMKLVGASAFTVHFPFFIEGVFKGLLGGIIAALTMYASTTFALTIYPELILDMRIFPMLVSLGLLIGIAASIMPEDLDRNF